MNKHLRNFIILIFPFALVVLVNEYPRPNQKIEPFRIGEVVAMNSNSQMKEKCSWACHHNTNFCKENHVKHAKPYFEQIDPFYFGIIDSMDATGSYQLANVLFLAFLWPLMLFFLVVKTIALHLKIKKNKKS